MARRYLLRGMTSCNRAGTSLHRAAPPSWATALGIRPLTTAHKKPVKNGLRGEIGAQNQGTDGRAGNGGRGDDDLQRDGSLRGDTRRRGIDIAW